MADKLRATVEQAGDTSMVTLAGFLDENNNLKKLVAKIPAGTAEIDLGGVERINSVGIRDWVNWLAALDANGTRTVLVACSPAIVAQINLVKNFAGNGAVKSFQVPFHCRECDEEKIVVVETAEMSEPGAEPPSCPCAACGRAMDIDEMPESYFAFLGTAAVPDNDREMARGSSAVVKSRVKTRERKSSPPERQSRPSLSAFQTPAHGTKRTSSNPLLAKRPSRPSQQNIAVGSDERISAPRISGVQINVPRPSASTVTPKSHVAMLIAIVLVLLAGIGALGYIVFMQ
jgi:anti-anti-sigma regulatory factor